MAGQQLRFQELLTALMDPGLASLPFLDWLRKRVVERSSRDGAQVSWNRFEQDAPALAQAALRFFFTNEMPLPRGVRLHERHRQPPTADDWVAMIEDYCTGYLGKSAQAEDQAAYEQIRRALPSLGYVLTHQGVRSYVSPVDRVLALSASKGVAAQQILDVEQQALGPHLRALVLCDYELAGAELLAELRGILDPEAGSAGLLLQLLIFGCGHSRA